MSLAPCIQKFHLSLKDPFYQDPFIPIAQVSKLRTAKSKSHQQEVTKIQVCLIPKPEFPTITAPTEGWTGVLAALRHSDRTHHRFFRLPAVAAVARAFR